MFVDICKTHIDDDISFEFRGIDDIREDDEYGGYRVSLTATIRQWLCLLKSI